MKLLSKSQLIGKLISNKKFRDAFVFENITTGVPFQIRAMREERELTQAQLAEAADKPRNVITRLEDPNYGKLTLRTLIEMACALNVGLLVKFVPFTRLVREYDDVSPSALSAIDITQPSEIRGLKAWAKAKERSEVDSVEDCSIAGGRFTVLDGGAVAQRTLAFERQVHGASSGAGESVAFFGGVGDVSAVNSRVAVG